MTHRRKTSCNSKTAPFKTAAAEANRYSTTAPFKTAAAEANRYSTTIFSKVAAVALTIKR